jgi:hypothetical protein
MVLKANVALDEKEQNELLAQDAVIRERDALTAAIHRHRC